MTDAKWMARAIKLAAQGRYTTEPNPAVGCVIVKDGELVGEGWHKQAGTAHAEVHALNMAGDRARGATAYVTLEPCAHYGRTPPCAEALVKAGVAKVIAAMVDPNPKVAGKGLKILEDAGIATLHGLLEADARALNPGFLKKMETGLPFVRLKLAASLDGRTALKNGQSKWITGPDARADVQRLRAMSGAIITGAGTVLTDEPSLNVRAEQFPDHYPLETLRQPLRVVLDRRQRLGSDNGFFQVPSPAWVVSHHTDHRDFPDHVEKLRLGEKDFLKTLLKKLPVNSVLVEAGAKLAGAFLSEGLVDELVLYLAPTLMGDVSRGLVELPVFTDMAQAPRFTIKDVRQVGNDIRLTLEV
ncbi:MAG: bifunctional diaminohydroxyphosphoribosylaminopyrimidine deaminase/5-amino-6-(5-phosphoribosylamino)uracil reductase RibD [Pseudomonadota bacterium]|uniref:bifunctional diaminohydroxyphosphoribosylaminopyrimidine deaminase/5-amino-6-(5-phosphoribosylamino)uracil reductase RibD n=1 Tax=Gallaecimonas pentaromativorans TaxID=584787 RepID=UPI00067E719A|nr:bifunctional diaminohydroxyphosphoribosylaminopyrimidine deaminase/5-amino-6-(5-phosphoribosylamino)uracil reductase RibD [Gallaecimonas pentaromativorans]MED5525045.1 bifunctional diaminohydroxyphosphoribosylaminopyrimidine deaminase/5-amino-6-(5-phosphoribosylamino)uracil reductase RibD [Pseudomonadota bacterium]